MGRRKGEMPAAVSDLARRVEHWRATRTQRSPMPQSLWAAAASLARTHGTHAVARSLRLSYDSLKSRVAAGGVEQRASSSQALSFVELQMPPALSSVPASGTQVELVGERGERLSIRLAAGAELDVVGLLRSFWDRPA